MVQFSTKKSEFFREYKVGLSISLDGPRRCHDVFRKDLRGVGTYERVIKTIEALKKAKVTFGIECTYTSAHENEGVKIKDLILYFSQFTKYFQISKVLTKDSMIKPSKFVDVFIEPIKYLTRKNPLYNSATVELLWNMLSEKSQIKFCDAQNMITVFPNGDVYPCYLLKHDNFFMGNLFERDFPGERYERVLEKIQRVSRENHLKKKYWFRFIPPKLCLGSFLSPHFDLSKPITLHSIEKDLSKKYEKLILELIKLRNNRKLGIVIKNINDWIEVFGQYVSEEYYK